jgi:hypothetical protein
MYYYIFIIFLITIIYFLTDYCYKKKKKYYKYEYEESTSKDESNIITNDNIKLFDKLIIDIRKNEYSIQNTKLNKYIYTTTCHLIKCIYKHFFNDNYFDIQNIPYYNELIDRYTFLYNYMNENNITKINNIKVFHISKHNNCVEYILRNTNSNEIGTILHFDSHPDTNCVSNQKKLLINIKNNGPKINNKLKHKYHKHVNDIGCVLVPLMIPYEKNNGIIWIKPNWVFYSSGLTKAYINMDKKECNIYGNHSLFMKPNKCEKKIDVDFHIKQIHDKKYILENTTNNFILNIDLDYFVTYGENKYAQWGNTHIDPVSDGRVYVDEHYVLKNELLYNYNNYKINREMEMIRNRVDNFIELLIYLKENGKLPSIIILCDSTQLNFSNYKYDYTDNNDNFEGFHEFTPKYFTYWLHNVLMNALNDIYI